MRKFKRRRVKTPTPGEKKKRGEKTVRAGKKKKLVWKPKKRSPRKGEKGGSFN